MARPIPYHECCRIRDALKESDRIDALVDRAGGMGCINIPEEEFDSLCIQQQAMWALVRNLVMDAAETTSYEPPVCVDIGDAVIIVYEGQDSANDCREMDAGWIASRRIVRPGETPEWAVKSETPEDEDDDDEFAFKTGDN